jgi:hypothetical protein
MDATEVIETYIDDTVRFLPKQQRDDVTNELRSLLNEELNDRALETGRPPDESLALSLVRGYGRPTEAAARYQPPWAIIDPADSARFLRAAIIGVGSLLLLSALRTLQPALPGTEEDSVKVAILAWLGFLVIAFGAKSWIRRRWPASGAWTPRDRDRVSRVGTAVLVPIATFVVVLYAAPAWVLNRISRGRLNTSWAVFTADFQQFRLPWFIGAMAGLIVLLALVAIQGRWRRLTRRINIGLNMAVAGMVLTFAVDGNVFQSGPVDQIARDVLALIAVIYVPCVGVQLYGEIGRGERIITRPGSTDVKRKPRQAGNALDDFEA